MVSIALLLSVLVLGLHQPHVAVHGVAGALEPQPSAAWEGGSGRGLGAPSRNEVPQGDEPPGGRTGVDGQVNEPCVNSCTPTEEYYYYTIEMDNSTRNEGQEGADQHEEIIQEVLGGTHLDDGEVLFIYYEEEYIEREEELQLIYLPLPTDEEEKGMKDRKDDEGKGLENVGKEEKHEENIEKEEKNENNQENNEEKEENNEENESTEKLVSGNVQDSEEVGQVWGEAHLDEVSVYYEEEYIETEEYSHLDYLDTHDEEKEIENIEKETENVEKQEENEETEQEKEENEEKELENEETENEEKENENESTEKLVSGNVQVSEEVGQVWGEAHLDEVSVYYEEEYTETEEYSHLDYLDTHDGKELEKEIENETEEEKGMNRKEGIENTDGPTGKEDRQQHNNKATDTRQDKLSTEPEAQDHHLSLAAFIAAAADGDERPGPLQVVQVKRRVSLRQQMVHPSGEATYLPPCTTKEEIVWQASTPVTRQEGGRLLPTGHSLIRTDPFFGDEVIRVFGGALPLPQQTTGTRPADGSSTTERKASSQRRDEL